MFFFVIVRYHKGYTPYNPILYKVALDINPVQASAVPCELVFSSNKETGTDRRSNTSGSLTEVLQILKYLGWSRQLNFTSGLLATEEECTVIDVQPSTLTELLRTGDIEGLKLTSFLVL